MAEEYLLKVAKGIEKNVASYVFVTNPPSHLRLSSMAPLTNYGYPAGVEGYVLRIDDKGIVIGAEGREDVPRLLVPWQNVSYVADGTGLAKAKGQK